jgi:hypothetical protein
MRTAPLLHAALLAAGLLFNMAPDGQVGMARAQAQDGMRPEVGKPLQAAGTLLKSGKAKEALAEVRKADDVPNKTATEKLMIDRMRGAAAQRAGDNATAIQSFESALASGKLSGAEQAQTAEALAFAYSQNKDWPKTLQWAQKAQQAGGGSAQLKQLVTYAQSQSGDYSAVARDAAAAVSAAEQAGRKPNEDDLLRLADAYERTNQPGPYGQTLEKLLLHYPKKEYWSTYLVRLQRKPGFSNRLALDVYRLQLASGNLTKANDYMEAAQLALQAGLPAEGKKIVEQGMASGVLGTGPEADRHKRLLDLAMKQDAEANAGIEAAAAEAANAKDGNALVNTGYAYVTNGQADKGIAMIEKGIAKGGLKRPEDAKLRMGMALLKQGKSKAKAIQTLRSVQGADGTADIARLWAIVANQSG